MDREELVDEALMLLPVLGRGLGRPSPVELAEVPDHKRLKESHVSPGHIQILIALARGPHAVGRLAEVLGVSTPAVSQLVDRLVESGIVERRHSEGDRRVVLVDYAPGEKEIARRIVEARRRPLEWTVSRMTDDEAQAFLKGMKLLVESFDVVHGKGTDEPHR